MLLWCTVCNHPCPRLFHLWGKNNIIIIKITILRNRTYQVCAQKLWTPKGYKLQPHRSIAAPATHMGPLGKGLMTCTVLHHNSHPWDLQVDCENSWPKSDKTSKAVNEYLLHAILYHNHAWTINEPHLPKKNIGLACTPCTDKRFDVQPL